MFFKNFEVKGPADKTLIYLTVYISKVLEVIAKSPEKDKATAAVFKLSMEPVQSSSAAGFFMKALCKPNPKDEEKFKKYLQQCKQECSKRMMDILYHPQWGTMDLKWWLQFSKRKFLKMDFN